MTMNQTPPQTYHLYGRKTYSQPLTFAGQVTIDDVAVLKDEAMKLIEETDWIELVAIPETSLIPVIVGGNPA